MGLHAVGSIRVLRVQCWSLAAASLHCSALVVIGKIAILAEAFRVVSDTFVRALPSFLGTSLAMIAVDAHALGIVGLVGVRASHNYSLLVDLVRTVQALNFIAIGRTPVKLVFIEIAFLISDGRLLIISEAFLWIRVVLIGDDSHRQILEGVALICLQVRGSFHWGRLLHCWPLLERNLDKSLRRCSNGVSTFMIDSFCSVKMFLFQESTLQECFIHGYLIFVQLIKRVMLFFLQIEHDAKFLERGRDLSSSLGLSESQLLALGVVHGTVSRCDNFSYFHGILQIEQRHCLGYWWPRGLFRNILILSSWISFGVKW